MKTSFFKVMALGCSVLVIFNSCGKLRDLLDPKIEQHNSDSNEYKAELDQVDNDINDALSDIPAFGKTEGSSGVLSSPLCGVIIDSSEIAQQILYFNFDGSTPCFSPSRTRSGQIKVELIAGNHWSEANAVLKETFIDFKIVRLSDNRSIEFDGVKTLKNLNGNDWLGFVAGSSTLAYQERALDIDVTFDNTQTAVWNSARTTEWSYTPGGTDPNIPYAYVTFVATGDTTLNGISNIDSWGVNRYGNDFTTYYAQPVTSNTYCGLWRFNSGEMVLNVGNADYTLTLGVDQSGNPTSNTCAYGFKVSWNIGNNSNSAVYSY